MDNVTREITFFSPGGLHDEAVEPISDEAKRRGHDVRFSRDVTDSAEIGVYTQHTHKISAINADLSFVSFHGIDQGYTEWTSENWNRFDVGLLPSKVAAENWQSKSWQPRIRPKIGVFPVGWPKSDVVFTAQFQDRVDQLVQEYDIDDGRTTIYAPTVENDGKLHDYVAASRDVADTILVKHAPYESAEYLADVYDQYEDDDQVYLLDPSEPIFPCLAAADVLVSDESSVLQEAALTDTIPVSVTDWPMRDRERPYPGVQLPEFALKTERDQLSGTLTSVFENYEQQLSSLEEHRDRHYANVGESASVTVDLIEAIATGSTPPVEPVEPVSGNLETLRSAYFDMRSNVAKPYHRTRAAFVNRLSDEHIETLERLGLHKVLHLVDKAFGKRKYR